MNLRTKAVTAVIAVLAASVVLSCGGGWRKNESRASETKSAETANAAEDVAIVETETQTQVSAQNRDDRLVGTWDATENYYIVTFHANGNFEGEGYDADGGPFKGTWSTTNNNVLVEHFFGDYDGHKNEGAYSFDEQGRLIHVLGEERVVLVRKQSEKTIENTTTQTQSSETFTDPRDNKTYRTVKIGNQTWMAENLNYAMDKSWCYDNADSNCVRYGRLYNWDAAMKACPAGWRLPSDKEWDDLMVAVGGVRRGRSGISGLIAWEKAGTKLKAKTGWNTDDGNGTDDFGFSALPGGYHISDGSFNDAGNYGYWWSATEVDDYDAWGRGMSYSDGVDSDDWGKDRALSVRCVRE